MSELTMKDFVTQVTKINKDKESIQTKATECGELAVAALDTQIAKINGDITKATHAETKAEKAYNKAKFELFENGDDYIRNLDKAKDILEDAKETKTDLESKLKWRKEQYAIFQG